MDCCPMSPPPCRPPAGKSRAATVVAVTDGVLWRIGRDAFRSTLQVRLCTDKSAPRQPRSQQRPARPLAQRSAVSPAARRLRCPPFPAQRAGANPHPLPPPEPQPRPGCAGGARAAVDGAARAAVCAAAAAPGGGPQDCERAGDGRHPSGARRDALRPRPLAASGDDCLLCSAPCAGAACAQLLGGAHASVPTGAARSTI